MSEVAIADAVDGPGPETCRHDNLVRDPEGEACRVYSHQELAQELATESEPGS